jgi:RHS repeat-associated protein
MLDEDADLNWLDYGFRNYDPQIGRFPQLDPLTDEYPFLTPYQYASNDPITNIDIDGLEGGGSVGGAAASAGGDFTYTAAASFNFMAFTASVRVATATTSVVSTASKSTNILSLIGSISSILIHSSISVGNIINTNFTSSQIGGGPKWQAYLQSVALRGGADAALHANSFGVFGADHSEDYNTDEEKAAYLRGRVGGDIATMGTAATEVQIGEGGLLTTGFTGVGALVSGGLAVHGAVAGGIATADMSTSLQKLYKLQGGRNANSSKPPKYTPPKQKGYLKDFVTKNTQNLSAYFKSEREARNLARTKLGKNPIEIEPNKWRSSNGKWQYRAKPGDVNDRHIHLEELNPQTGEVLTNYHLRW